MAALALGCATLPGATHARVATHARASAVRGADASLPLLAQGPVSAALGRADPAYRVRGLRASNPRQRLRVEFSRRGVTVASRAAHFSVTLSAYGYASALRPARSPVPDVNANRVSYTEGALTEWFANGPLGLEQGFDLAARPRAGSGPLTFSLALSGNLEPRIQRGSLLLSGDGVSLRYGRPLTTDARGRPLPAWLALAGDHLLIRVDDRRAAYPLHIDPFIQQAELATRHGARGEEFGESVAISGNTIVVGTPNYVVASSDVEQGAAYVFTAPASGWAHAVNTAVLTAKDGRSEELFGHSVSVSGNTIVVGAPFREVGKHAGQGAAYVFVKPASGWRNATPTAELIAAGGAANEFFGESVSVSGATVVVGAPSRRVGRHPMQGAVDVFERPPGGWADSPREAADLTASDGAADDALGISVAISARTIVAGADQHAIGKTADEGAAYVFVKPASGWRNATQTAELMAGEGQSGELFAHSVGVSLDTIVAGAPDRSVDGNARAGAVYVFVKPASGWAGALTETAELTASDGAKNEALGGSTAISGDAIVTGATFRKVGKNPEQGAVYVFVKPASGWAGSLAQTAELTAAGGTAGDSLGRSVAISESTIIAGAPDRKVARTLAQGAVYVFAGSVAR